MRNKLSEKKFVSLMREIDSELHRKGVPIHARQIQAVGELANKLNISLPIAPIPNKAMPGNYEGLNLSAHVINWFENRYGDRLSVDFSIGYSLVLIRGDAWLLRFPLMFGNVTVVCERDLSRQFDSFVVNRRGAPPKKPIMNLLKFIDKLPQGLSNQLEDSELVALIKYYAFGHKCFHAISNFCKGNALVENAVSDLKASAQSSVGNSFNYGQSRWSSLQAAEKMLKYYIQEKNKKFPHTHMIFHVWLRLLMSVVYPP